MTGRLMFSKILINPNKFVRPLLQQQKKQFVLQNQSRNAHTTDDFRIRPLSKMFESPSMFSLVRIKKKFEVIPIIALVIIDVVGQSILITRNCFTRDDVRWRTKSPMLSEIIQMDPDKKVWYRKVLNIAQPVSQPEGPIKAYEESDYIEKNNTFISSPFNEKLFENDNKEPEEEPEPEPAKQGKKDKTLPQKAKQAAETLEEKKKGKTVKKEVVETLEEKRKREKEEKMAAKKAASQNAK